MIQEVKFDGTCLSLVAVYSQAYALFVARRLGDGVLRVSLLQVGGAPGAEWRPEPPLGASLAVRVVSPVYFRLLPRQHSMHAAPKRAHLPPARHLTAPLVLAPGAKFSVEPAGGSGNLKPYALNSKPCSGDREPQGLRLAAFFFWFRAT